MVISTGWNIQEYGILKTWDNDKTVVVKVVAGKEAGNFAVSVKTEKKAAPFYSDAMYKVSPNDVLEFKADVKGKGEIRFFAYCYNAGRYVTNLSTPAIAVTPGDEVKSVIKVPAQIKYTHIRIAFEIQSYSDVVFNDFEVEQKADKM